MSQQYFPPPPFAAAAKQTVVVSSTAQLSPEEAKLQTRWRVVDSVRSALIALSVAASLVVLVVSVQAQFVYDRTHVSASLGLPLWPSSLDTRPTVALIACSTIAMVSSIASLASEKLVCISPLKSESSQLS